MTREEFREQMTRCPACGQLVDGDVCDARCAAALDLEREDDDEEEEDADDDGADGIDAILVVVFFISLVALVTALTSAP